MVRTKKQSMSRFLSLTLVVPLLVALWNPLFAQEMHTIRSNCMAEVQNFCSSAKHDSEAIKQCLLSRQDKLSASCKAIFPKRLILLARESRRTRLFDGDLYESCRDSATSFTVKPSGSFSTEHSDWFVQ